MGCVQRLHGHRPLPVLSKHSDPVFNEDCMKRGTSLKKAIPGFSCVPLNFTAYLCRYLSSFLLRLGRTEETRLEMTMPTFCPSISLTQKRHHKKTSWNNTFPHMRTDVKSFCSFYMFHAKLILHNTLMRYDN